MYASEVGQAALAAVILILTKVILKGIQALVLLVLSCMCDILYLLWRACRNLQGYSNLNCIK